MAIMLVMAYEVVVNMMITEADNVMEEVISEIEGCFSKKRFNL